jgi:D-alanine-D-alanine ligase
MKITVLMGGTSSERNVSLASGIRIVQALRSRGHDVTPLDPARGLISASEERELSTGKVGTKPPSLEELSKFAEGTFLPNLTTMKEIKGADVVFLALHGGQGEDGTIQALWTWPTSTSPAAAISSALAMDGIFRRSCSVWRK